MKKNILGAKAMAVVLAATSIVPMAARAQGGALGFSTGEIADVTCTISTSSPGGNGSTTFSVRLPTLQLSALATPEATAGLTAFTFHLRDCTPREGTARVYFEYASANTNFDTYRLRNTTGPGRATNVEIGLLNADLSPLKLGEGVEYQGAPKIARVDGGADLRYYAQYVATDGPATSGTVYAALTYTFDWH